MTITCPPFIRRYFLYFLSAIVLGACATSSDQLDRLNQALGTYEKAVRWADFDSAYALHKNKQAVPDQLKDIRVTRYEVKDLQFDSATMSASQTASIRYYNTGTSREHELEQQQLWEYDQQTKRWLLISEPPAFE